MIYHENREYESGFPIHSRIFNNINFLAHWHAEIEIVTVLEGCLLMGINSMAKILKKGDIAICTGGDIHYYESKNSKSTVLVTVFRPELLNGVINMSSGINFVYPFIDKATIESIDIKPSVLTEIDNCISCIYKELNAQDKCYQIIVKSHLLQLMGLFLRYLPQQSNNQDYNIKKCGNIRLVQDAIKYIESNYMNDISLEDVSAYLGISPAYFSKKFSSVTGQNYKTYLNLIRIEKAANLLKFSADPIIDIAYECGFNSIRTFNRVFKSIKGFPPSRFQGELKII